MATFTCYAVHSVRRIPVSTRCCDNYGTAITKSGWWDILVLSVHLRVCVNHHRSDRRREVTVTPRSKIKTLSRRRVACNVSRDSSAEELSARYESVMSV